jgi:N-acetylmuramoyl-L-alanine amidase
MVKVFLGVGHGGGDPGAMANGLQEKQLTLAVAKECALVLQRHGVTVLMSRTKDENDTLNDEIKECNNFAPKIAVDIHINAGGGDGCEVFYHYGGGLSKTLAENITSEIVKIGQNLRKGTSGKYDGLKYRKNIYGRDYYAFIRQTTCPAVICEAAFIDNKTDIAIIDTLAEQKNFGLAIAKAILKTLGINFVEEKPVEIDKNNGGKIYRCQVGAYSVYDNAVKMRDKLKAAGFNAIIVEGVK